MKAFLLAALAVSPAAAFPWSSAPAAELIYSVEPTGKPGLDAELAGRAATVLQQRVKSFGLNGSIEKRAGGRIAVLLNAKDDDPEVLLAPLLKPARLEFRIAHPEKTAPGPGETTVLEYDLDPDTQELRKTPRVVDKDVKLTGADIVSAEAAVAPVTGRPQVLLRFGAAGAKRLAAVTAAALDKSMAIVIDGRLMSAPVIRAPIDGGLVTLDGNFTMQEARDTAKVLASGPLPAGLTLIQKIIGGKVVPPPERPAVAAAASPAAAPEITAKVSDVDAPPPAVARGRANAVAVVIGVERTRQNLPRADYAAKDAKVFADYLVKTLGYPEENVVLLTDERAAKSDFEKYLEDWLPGRAAPGATVVVYFSGHGAPDAARGSSYLVPYDGDPTFLAKTAYPLSRLYETLGRLKGRRSIVLLDACFSGAGRRSALAKGARPLVTKVAATEPPAELAVLSAAASNQIGGADDAEGHGLFTYYVLRALKDDAAAGRVPTMQELYQSVSGKVEAQARRLTGDEQTPELQGTDAARGASL